MFFISQLQHKLRLPSHKLDVPLEDGLIDELQSIFLDKVIPKLGLCVSICDIKSIDGGFVLPNDGAPTYTVVFRMIMFRPYVGEVISRKLKESDSNGIRRTRKQPMKPPDTHTLPLTCWPKISMVLRPGSVKLLSSRSIECLFKSVLLPPSVPPTQSRRLLAIQFRPEDSRQ